NGADYFYGPDTELSTDWKVYSFPLTIGKDLPEHRTVFDMGHTNIPLLIDHMALVPGTVELSGTPGGPSEELMNGSFEDGLNNWMVLNGALDVSTAEAYCGSQSLTATGAGGNPWDVQIASDPVALEVDKQYKLGFWAKAAGPDGLMRASVSRWASGQTDDFFYTPDITVAEDWTYYGFIFTAASTSTGDHNVVLDFGATTQTFFVDDLRVYEIDPCE
ncbi:MAG: carbohydrate binding domain-containing protein, partial [Phaeodactylibacter sp.]|nr:carbohydrate binding domain-containing protein [Phaeodactylibacter sp.]